MASDRMESSIRTITYDGKDRGKYGEWAEKVLAAALMKGIWEMYTQDKRGVPTQAQYDAGGTGLTTAKKENFERNQKAYAWLILCVSDDAFDEVADAKTTELPYGKARLAWKNLKERYEPSKAKDFIKIDGDYNKLFFDVQHDPRVFFQLLNRLNRRLKEMGKGKDEDTVKWKRRRHG
jgi:hypothetical protein